MLTFYSNDPFARMTARTLTWLVVVVLALVALGLGAVLLTQKTEGATPRVPVTAEACDSSALPPPLLAGENETPLLIWAEGTAKVSVDGKTVLSTEDDLARFQPGTHTVRIECKGEAPEESAVELEPFRTAAVYAVCRPGPVIVVLGATCSECRVPAKGNTVERAVATAALDDDTDAALKAAAKAGKTGLAELAVAYARVDKTERTRQSAVSVQRWNLLTERYQRLLLAIGREAAGAVASSALRMEELGAGFKAATQSTDAPGQAASVRAAEETLRVLVRAARTSRPGDCAFQQKLTASF